MSSWRLFLKWNKFNDQRYRPFWVKMIGVGCYWKLQWIYKQAMLFVRFCRGVRQAAYVKDKHPNGYNKIRVLQCQMVQISHWLSHTYLSFFLPTQIQSLHLPNLLLPSFILPFNLHALLSIFLRMHGHHRDLIFQCPPIHFSTTRPTNTVPIF